MIIEVRDKKKGGIKEVDIKGLVFDMDGLLFDSERVVQRSWTLTGEELGFGKEFGNHIYNTIGFNVKRREEYFRANVSADFPMQLFGDTTRKYFRAIADTEGIPLKMGALELIQYAKRNNLKIAVATSSSQQYGKNLMESGGIYELLDGSIHGDMVTHGKPHPEIYERACELIGLKPEECLALEDSPSGIQSAYRAGLTTIMIPDLVEPSDEIRAQVDFIFENLLQVIDLL